jgi:hypothetical protein
VTLTLLARRSRHHALFTSLRPRDQVDSLESASTQDDDLPSLAAARLSPLKIGVSRDRPQHLPAGAA